MTWATLYTDAGWSPAEKRARCAIYIRTHRGKHTAVGEAYTDTSIAAEALAVLFGLRWLVEQHSDLRGIYLRSDCLPVLMRIKNAMDHGCRHCCTRCIKGLKGDYRKILEQVLNIVKKKKIRIEVKHVRAHGKEVDAKRRYLNDVVDRMSSMKGYSPSPVKRPSSGSMPESESSSQSSSSE